MDQHLCITFDPLVKLLVCHHGIVDGHLVTHHKARLCLAGYNQIAQVSEGVRGSLKRSVVRVVSYRLYALTLHWPVAKCRPYSGQQTDTSHEPV